MSIDDIYRQAAKRRDRKVKIFGERNTGTRAVLQMLRAHEGVAVGFPTVDMPDLDILSKRIDATLLGFQHEMFSDAIDDIRRSRLGAVNAWKHAAPILDDSYAAIKASVLFMVRDPYSWIAALYRTPYHARAPMPKTLAAFLEHPWLTVQRENIDPVLMTPMELWNAKLRAYIAFIKAAPVPLTVIHFEDFVLDPVASLTAALRHFGYPSKGLAEVEAPTKRLGVGREERLKYYKTNAWEKEISTEAAELINKYVDWDVAAAFGYSLREPSEF